MLRQKRKRRLKLGLLLFWPLGLLLAAGTSYIPVQVEKYFSLGFAKHINQYLSQATGIFPFSLGELTAWLLGLLLLIFFLATLSQYLYRRMVKKDRQAGIKAAITGFLFKLAALSGVIYVCFLLLWGLNYNRLSFAEIAGLDVNNVTQGELIELCDKLISQANTLRDSLEVDARGVMSIAGGFETVREEAAKAFPRAAAVYPELGGDYGKPKPVFFSRQMSYTGVTGIYFPFTGEANVNIDIPDCTLPATTVHEMVHQRGFAREDEANYLAWLVCNAAESLEFQYSGTVLALNYSLQALRQVAPAKAKELQTKYSQGLRRDLEDLAEYWRKHEGQIEEITSDINDAYLKSNGQEDGIHSYGRMVDLLIAQQRQKASL